MHAQPRGAPHGSPWPAHRCCEQFQPLLPRYAHASSGDATCTTGLGPQELLPMLDPRGSPPVLRPSTRSRPRSALSLRSFSPRSLSAPSTRSTRRSSGYPFLHPISSLAPPSPLALRSQAASLATRRPSRRCSRPPPLDLTARAWSASGTVRRSTAHPQHNLRHEYLSFLQPPLARRSTAHPQHPRPCMLLPTTCVTSTSHFSLLTSPSPAGNGHLAHLAHPARFARPSPLPPRSLPARSPRAPLRLR